MYRFFNPNPCGRSVDDCAVRALAAAFDVPWEQAYDVLSDSAKQMCDMPGSVGSVSAILRQMGFVCEAIGDYMTVGEFADTHPKGVYVLGLGGHIVTVIDGVILDSFDPSSEAIELVWYRDRERDRRVRNV